MRLIVHLIEGRNLPARDINFLMPNTSDPYCVLSIGNERYKSNIISRNLNPVWNQTFVFQNVFPNTPLYIGVYDYDEFSKDDPLGSAYVQLNSLVRNVPQDLWINLSSRGSIHLKVTAEEFVQQPMPTPYQQPMPMPAPYQPMPTPYQQPYVQPQPMYTQPPMSYPPQPMPTPYQQPYVQPQPQVYVQPQPQVYVVPSGGYGHPQMFGGKKMRKKMKKMNKKMRKGFFF